MQGSIPGLLLSSRQEGLVAWPKWSLWEGEQTTLNHLVFPD